MKRAMARWIACAAVVATGCGSDMTGSGVEQDHDGAAAVPDSAATAPDAGTLPAAEAGSASDALDPVSPPDAAAAPDAAHCSATEAPHPDEGAQHLDLCSPTGYRTNPPSSGNHYPYWAAYKTYPSPFPRGFWVHDLEHGAVVITYNCPDGCAAEVSAAQQLIDALPTDPSCVTPVKRRILMLPDPALDVRFAASSWGFTLRADCFDAEAFASFIAAHYAHGLEDICANGIDPLTSAVGGGPVCAP
jgi:hypothetical protein